MGKAKNIVFLPQFTFTTNKKNIIGQILMENGQNSNTF